MIRIFGNNSYSTMESVINQFIVSQSKTNLFLIVCKIFFYNLILRFSMDLQIVQKLDNIKTKNHLN